MTELKRNYFSTHNHSSYSNALLGFPDSTNTIKDMLKYAGEIGLSGMALTDHEGLSGAIELLDAEKSLKDNGDLPKDFKVAIGDEIYLKNDRENTGPWYHHILIAKDEEGFHQLKKISSNAWEKSYHARGLLRRPTLFAELKEFVEENKGHLISQSSCLGGFLGQEILAMTRATNQEEVKTHKDNIDKFIKFNVDLFGDDFYLETQPAFSEDQHIANKWLAKLAKVYNVKLIFSTDSHYLKKEDRKIHEIFLKSKNSERETADFYSGTFMQTIEEVYEYFEGDFTVEEINSMVENTLEIKDKIKSYEGIFKPQQIPLVEVNPPKLKITKEQFELAKKYDSIARLAKSNDEQSLYWINTCLNRMSELNIFDEKHLHSLEYEASVMIGCSKKFNQPMTAYYNTTQFIVNMMWDDCETLVGASRGSALGYLSNYLLGICQIDPCKYSFVKPWRHLSVKRPDLPKV